jgi:hypothetical protein
VEGETGEAARTAERGVKLLRAVAVVLALSLMIGEAYRSWGVDRPVAFWMDDMLMGALLLVAAVLVGRETWMRRALFTGAWGTNAGMLYGSFFSKIFAPGNANAGNFDLGLLTALIGVAFATAILGFIASLMLPLKLAN